MNEVDELRQQLQVLQARLDALEGKSPSPPKPLYNGKLTERVSQTYFAQKPKLQALLSRQLSMRYQALAEGRQHLADLCVVSPHSHIPQRIDIEDLPRALAADLTHENEKRADLEGRRRADALNAGDPRHDNSNVIARLEVEVAALSACTNDLLESTLFPPMPEA